MPRFINWTAGPGGSLEPYRFPPLFTWDFTQQSPGALVLPTGLTFARASSGHTVQTGDSTLVTAGIGSNDVGRIGRLASAYNYGVFIEPARTNSYGRSRSANLASGTAGATTTYTTGRTGPDGTANAIRGQTASGAYSRFEAIGPITGNHVLSAWAAQGLGSGAYQVVGAYAGTTGAATGGTASAAWSRVVSATFPYPAASTAYINPWDGRANATLGSSAGARDCDLDFVQFEAGKYPTSAIITSGGSSATRAAERLTIDSTRSAASIVRGRLAIRLRFRAIAGLSALNYLSEGQLFESEDHEVGAWIPSNSRQIIVYANGSQSITASSTITWNAGDLLEFYFELGAGKPLCKWRVNSGAWNTAVWSVRDDTLAALSFTGGIDIMNRGGVWHTPAVLELMNTFVPGYF